MIAENSTTRSLPCVPIDDWRPSRSKRVSDHATRLLANAAGLMSQVFGSRAQDSFGILTYHRIAPLVRDVPPPPYNVAPEAFREQITGLLKRGFRFVRLAEAIDRHTSGHSLESNSIVLTFDDCFESVYSQAWPILQDLKVPATLFLSTSYLDSDAPFPFDTWATQYRKYVPPENYRPIRTEQCQEMAASGLVDLGTHTHTHADFRQHSAEFAAEMEVATEVIELRFGEGQLPFAFPFGNPHAGYASHDLLVAARSSGASCALTTECRLVECRDDPFGWGRITVFNWDTSFTLAGKLSGWYDWAPRLKHRLQYAFARRTR